MGNMFCQCSANLDDRHELYIDDPEQLEAQEAFKSVYLNFSNLSLNNTKVTKIFHSLKNIES